MSCHKFGESCFFLTRELCKENRETTFLEIQLFHDDNNRNTRKKKKFITKQQIKK